MAAALPGGDPLAAALAAGETPSPEMVAAAGGEAATVSPYAGVAWIAIVAALLLAVPWLADRTLVAARVPLTKPPTVLLDRADEIRRTLGYADTPADAHSGCSTTPTTCNGARVTEAAKRAGASSRRAGRPG